MTTTETPQLNLTQSDLSELHQLFAQFPLVQVYEQLKTPTNATTPGPLHLLTLSQLESLHLDYLVQRHIQKRRSLAKICAAILAEPTENPVDWEAGIRESLQEQIFEKTSDSQSDPKDLKLLASILAIFRKLDLDERKLEASDKKKKFVKKSPEEMKLTFDDIFGTEDPEEKTSIPA